MQKSKKFKILFVLLFTAVVFGGLAYSTADIFAQQNLNVDYPEIRLPGGVFNINKALQVGKLTIKQLVILIYGGIVLFAAIAAFFLLIYAGLAYILSGANPGMRKNAFQRFKNVWAGIGIILVSYFVLYIINPSIVNLDKSLVLQAISPESGQFLSYTFDPPEFKDRGTYGCEWVDGACIVARDDCSEGFVPSCGDPGNAEDCGAFTNVTCGRVGSGSGDGGEGGESGSAASYCQEKYDACIAEGNTPSECNVILDACSNATIACPVLKVTSSNTSYCYDRGHQRHNGHDIMAEKLTPIYAMEAGTLDKVEFSSFSGCKLWIVGTSSGRGYAHLHLGTTLDCSNAYAPGIRNGVQVTAGQHIGYVGTTYNGSASGTVPHLHLTIVKPSGTEECSPPPLSGNYGGPSMDGASLFRQAGCPYT